VKKLVFPLEILPVNLVASGIVTEAFLLVIFLATLLVARGAVPLTTLWLPVVLAPQVLLTVALGWFLAALGVYLRDLAQIVGFLLQLWFFLTPILYPESAIPSAAVTFFRLNPMLLLVRAYRSLLLEGKAPDIGQLAALTLATAVLALLGYAWF